MPAASTADNAFSQVKAVRAIRPAPLSLRRNFGWVLTGNLVYAACQWGMLVVLAKLTSPVLVGRFALGLAIATPVFMFANLHLSQAQATDARREYRFADYRGLRILSNLAAILFICVWVIVGRYDTATTWVVLLVAATKAVESGSDVFHGLFQQRECMNLSALSVMLRGVLSLAVFGCVVAVTRRLDVGLVGVLLAWTAVLILFDSRNGARFGAIRPTFNWPVLGRLAWLVLPLGVVSGLGSLGSELPRFFLNSAHGEAELGLFAAVASLSRVGTLFSMAMSRSAAPRLARLHADGAMRQFVRLLAKLMALGFLVGCAGVLGSLFFGERFLAIAFGPEYAEKTGVLMWVMLAMGLVTTGTFLGTAVTAARRFPVQMAIHAGKILVAAAICHLLVPRYGSLAAAWSLAASALFSVLAFAAVTWWIVVRRQAGPALGAMV
jgi:O-antigen/teichoic acid export membrane protein